MPVHVGYYGGMSDNSHTLDLIKKFVELARGIHAEVEINRQENSYKRDSEISDVVENESELAIFMGTILSRNGQPLIILEREIILWDTYVPQEEELETQEFPVHTLVIDGIEFDLLGNVGPENIVANIFKRTSDPRWHMYKLGEPQDISDATPPNVYMLSGMTNDIQDRATKQVMELVVNARANTLDQNTEPAPLTHSTRPRI